MDQDIQDHQIEDLEDVNVVRETQETTSVEQAPKRKRKRKSRAWEFFDLVPKKEGEFQKAKCKACNVLLVYESKTHGTKNLLLHIDNCPRRKTRDVSQYMLSGGEGSLVTRSSAFDNAVFREQCASAIIEHEIPFSFVEYRGIRRIFRYLYEDTRFFTRNSARLDVMKMYQKEKKALLSLLVSTDGKIYFTSNLWMSINTDRFITLTAHFVDKNWELQKKILSFALLASPHTGMAIYEKIWALLCEWKVESRILTFTLDNASSNDTFVRQMKEHLSLNGTLLRSGKYFHVRCCAHIINLIVKDGLQHIHSSVECVQESIKYIKGSQARKQKFVECVKEASIDSRRGLRQDVPTRWNSTYLMLDNARTYRRAFSHLKLTDPHYLHCPTESDWDSIDRICNLVVPFYETTLLFSGTKYATSNLYSPQVFRIHHVLRTAINSDNFIVREMANPMFEKFSKYWKYSNLVLAIAVILDPRYKMKLVEYSYKKLYGNDSREFEEVRSELFALFDVYTSNSACTSADPSSTISDVGLLPSDLLVTDDFFSEFLQSDDNTTSQKSKLEIYLEENRLPLEPNRNLDVLSFWKGYESRYPQLSKMAKDILSIPLSTVASESAFSTSGRILDQYRSSLSADVVEALVCTRDWLYSNIDTTDEIPIEETSEDVLTSFIQGQESQASTNIVED